MIPNTSEAMGQFSPTMTEKSPMNVTMVFAAAAIAVYVTRVYLQWRRLSHVPGPFWASITKFWMAKHTLRGCQPYVYKAVSEKYGSLARVGPNELITNDPVVQRKMGSVRSPYRRGEWYNAMRFDPSRDHLLSIRDPVAHGKLRQKMSPGYSGKEIESAEAGIETHISSLINLIERKYLSKPGQYNPMDFAEKSSFFTLDVVSDLAFGQPFGYLARDKDLYDFNQISRTFMPIMMVTSDIPVITKFLHSRLLRGLLPSESDKLGFGALIGIAKRIVGERFAPGAPSQHDMLGSFMRHGLNQEEASGEALLQVVAGNDTSASSIRSVMLNIMMNPLTYLKLQREIDAAIEAGNISSPVKDAEARKMPYLQAVIKESMRFMPPGTGAFFREVPPAGETIDGKFIPGGTQVGISVISMQHSKSIYGADADIFRPERWIEASPEKFTEMSSTVELIFSYGKYVCLGKGIALMEFNKIFVELLRRFDFSISNPLSPMKYTIAGIWIMEDFWVRVESRH